MQIETHHLVSWCIVFLSLFTERSYMSGRKAAQTMDQLVQAKMQQEQQRQRAEEAARQAAELAACQKAAETEAARQAIAAKVTSSCCFPVASLNNLSILLGYGQSNGSIDLEGDRDLTCLVWPT